LLVGLLLINGSLAVFGQTDDVKVTYHQAANAPADSSKLSGYKQDAVLEKIAVGGTFGLWIGGGVYFSISPDISYHFNQWVALGIGGTYNLDYNNYYRISNHMFGIRVFAESHLFNIVGVYVAYEAINLDNYIYSQKINDRIWANNLSFGGGFYQRIGRFSTYAYLLYNVCDKEAYMNDISIKAGFNFFLK
jgi:hypothetical protein